MRIAAFLRAILVAAGLSLSFAAPVLAEQGESSSLESAQRRSVPDFDAVALAREPVWLALVHQSRRSVTRLERAAYAESSFFLAPEGSSDPYAELLASRDAFLNADEVIATKARCNYPARYAFLAERNLVPADRGRCEELDAWRERIGDIELTLVFPDAFLGNPASMFGHTLLRFDPVGGRQASSDALLGWTLDYTADSEGNTSLLYMIRGVFGAYKGRFGISRYYEKTRLYSDWQDRDIWEYPIEMGPAERERVLLHVWELRNVSLPYFFFTKNCSDILLDVLEVGWPGIKRAGGMPPTITPVDTLRALAARAPKGLGTPHLRASPASRLQASLAELTPNETKIVLDLVEGRITTDAENLAAQPIDRRAAILTAAYDLLRHRFLEEEISDEDSRPRARALLRARSQIEVPSTPPRLAAHRDQEPPNTGHGTAQASLSAGIQDRDAFVEMRLLPTFHTLLDAPGGYAEGGEIRVLEGALRYYPELDRVRLHELVLLDIATASPWRAPFRPIGWRTEISARTRMLSRDRGRGLEAASVFRAQGGFGAATAPRPRLLLYAFGEAVLEAAPGIEGNAAAGPVLRTGLTWSTKSGGYTIQAEGIAGALLGTDTSEWLRIKLEQRLSITPEWSVTLGAHHDRAYDVGHTEARLGFTRYF